MQSGIAVATQSVHEYVELGVAGVARGTIGEMFGDGRIDRLVFEHTRSGVLEVLVGRARAPGRELTLQIGPALGV